MHWSVIGLIVLGVYAVMSWCAVASLQGRCRRLLNGELLAHEISASRLYAAIASAVASTPLPDQDDPAFRDALARLAERLFAEYREETAKALLGPAGLAHTGEKF